MYSTLRMTFQDLSRILFSRQDYIVKVKYMMKYSRTISKILVILLPFSKVQLREIHLKSELYVFSNPIFYSLS